MELYGVILELYRDKGKEVSKTGGFRCPSFGFAVVLGVPTDWAPLQKLIFSAFFKSLRKPQKMGKVR